MTKEEIVQELSELGREMAEYLAQERNAMTSHPFWAIEESHFPMCRDEDAERFYCQECECLKALSEMTPFDECVECGADLSGGGCREERGIIQHGLVALTRSGGEALLARQAHNCTKPRLYVESGSRSPELIRLRDLLMDLGRDRNELGKPSTEREIYMSTSVVITPRPIEIRAACSECNRPLNFKHAKQWKSKGEKGVNISIMPCTCAADININDGCIRGLGDRIAEDEGNQ